MVLEVAVSQLFVTLMEVSQKVVARVGCCCGHALSKPVEVRLWEELVMSVETASCAASRASCDAGESSESQHTDSGV